jgi:hypothetical protein
VLPKVMVAHVDVLRSRTKLGKSRKLQCPGVVFEDFAIDDGLGANKALSVKRFGGGCLSRSSCL